MTERDKTLPIEMSSVSEYNNENISGDDQRQVGMNGTTLISTASKSLRPLQAFQFTFINMIPTSLCNDKHLVSNMDFLCLRRLSLQRDMMARDMLSRNMNRLKSIGCYNIFGMDLDDYCIIQQEFLLHLAYLGRP